MIGSNLAKNPHNISIEIFERFYGLIRQLGVEISIEETKDNPDLILEDEQQYEDFLAELAAQYTPDIMSPQSYRHFILTFTRGEQKVVLNTSCPLVTKYLVVCGDCEVVQVHCQPCGTLPFMDTLSQHEKGIYYTLLFLAAKTLKGKLDSLIDNNLYLWAEAGEQLEYLQSHPDWTERRFQSQRRTVLKLFDIFGEYETSDMVEMGF